VGRPTADLATADALDTDRFFEAWAAGTAAVAALETDLLMLGELGIANTTAASAVVAGLLGGPVADWVGRGTGVDDLGYRNKVEAVTLAAARGPFPPLEALRRAGGAELVAMAAASVEARRRSIPMVLDGFIATAAQMPLELHTPGILDHALAGHCSAEGGHRRLLERLGKRPLVELDLRLGEATGALMALPLVRLAVSAVLDVGTFDDLGR
jgi:nicotinate-nucleotide--dimethylbenzimidazole phosphoribosyltransferase